jgi:hypothetical protein
VVQQNCSKGVSCEREVKCRETSGLLLFFSGWWVQSNTVPVAAQSLSKQSAPVLAGTPPMGWNSWDAYGATVTEAQVKEDCGVTISN